MKEYQILIVSDNQESARLWAYGLNQRSMPAVAVGLETDGFEKNISRTCGLIALDINESGCHVLSACRLARFVYDGPILLCTYERDERFHLKAYEAGIDESISKPIGNQLLIAKIFSWLRSAPSPSSHTNELAYPGFQLDSARRVLSMRDGIAIKLSSTELRFLLLLISNKGHVVESDEIIGRIWPESEKGNSQLLKNLVYRLRQKIELVPSRPQYIETVVGFGYRFGGGPSNDSLI